MNAFLAVCGVVVLIFTTLEAAWIVKNRRRVGLDMFGVVEYACFIAALIVCGVYAILPALLPAIAWMRGGGR